MTAAATSRPSPRGPWSPQSPSRVLSIPSTNPLGFPARTPGSTGQSTQARSAQTLSPHGTGAVRSPSPNYFEYVTDHDSNHPNSHAGVHANRHWSPPAAGHTPSAASSPPKYPLESQPRLENFRRQSATSTFNLSSSHFNSSTVCGPSPKVENVADKSDRRRREDGKHSTETTNIDPLPLDSRVHRGRSINLHGPFSDLPRQQSPADASNSDLSSLQRTQISHLDERHPRNSLPHNRVDHPVHSIQRSETLPSSIASEGPVMIPPQDLVELVKSHLPEDLLLLDLRGFPQYSKSRVVGAINLCIPTTLLKRASYDVKRLEGTFSKANDKAKFARWRDAKFIVVYDANSSQLKDATSSVNMLKKFTNEGWQGATCVIRGGFTALAKMFPDQVDERPASEMDGSKSAKLSIEPPAAAPVAGGCMMPAAKTAANPFFGTIRQNMDLIGGVGQLPVQLPSTLKGSTSTELPAWLGQASSGSDKGKTVSDRFLNIEKAEQRRMQKALSSDVSYGTPDPLSPQAVQIAGIEKGTKNRYKDILPFDHSRVRLQNIPSGGCDYVNASHVKAEWSNKHYIASQAPVPATFQDFWRVVWEQDARVIVMLTAESEGGHLKCHPYWLSGDYGPFKLKAFSERHLALEQPKSLLPRSFTSPLKNLDVKDRQGIGRRRSTNYSVKPPPSQTPPPVDLESPHIIVRKFTLTHTSHPFEPLREIIQLQYSSWPDFGAPAHPIHVLGLVECCDSAARSYQSSKCYRGLNEPACESERPIVVHCSAGCGRTGTFCTVDSVIDTMKRQRNYRQSQTQTTIVSTLDDAMDVGCKEEAGGWLMRDDEDLVAKTVSDFRLQRLSMVQTLRQFVLCYETVLEWVASELPENQRGLSIDKDRRSWGG